MFISGMWQQGTLWGLWIRTRDDSSFQSCKISLCSHVTGIGRSVICRTSDKRNFTKVFAFMSVEVYLQVVFLQTWRTLQS